MKGKDYSELKAPSFFEKLTMKQFGSPVFVNGEPTPEDFDQAKAGLAVMKNILWSGNYDLVVFDEINTAVYFHLVDVKDVLAVLDGKPEKTEVVLTGRYAPKEIVDRADLVTEMQEVKHYYNAGVKARIGIEE